MVDSVLGLRLVLGRPNQYRSQRHELQITLRAGKRERRSEPSRARQSTVEFVLEPDGLIAAQFAGYAAVYLVMSLHLGGALKLFQWIAFGSTAILTAVGAVIAP